MRPKRSEGAATRQHARMIGSYGPFALEKGASHALPARHRRRVVGGRAHEPLGSET